MCTLGKAMRMLDVSAEHPKYGYRTWDLRWNAASYKLRALFHDYDWKPERQQCECFPWYDYMPTQTQEITLGGNHGFYVTYWFHRAQFHGVLGVAAVSGKVAKHAHGYRGEWAQPKALLLPKWARQRGDVESSLRENYPQVKFFHHLISMIIWTNWHRLIRR